MNKEAKVVGMHSGNMYTDWFPSNGKKGSSKPYQPCYKSHPPLKLPGGDAVIYGGSCSTPIVGDADVYIGFDHSMGVSRRSWPWEPGCEFLFPITDMRAPSDPVQFKKLVAWTIKQLNAGRKVHCGCIGGHGRTGTFLSALVAELGEKDAITYVRDNYCERAVESSEQVTFLNKHFGAKVVKGYKQSYGGSGKKLSAPKGNRFFEPLFNAATAWGSYKDVSAD